MAGGEGSHAASRSVAAGCEREGVVNAEVCAYARNLRAGAAKRANHGALIRQYFYVVVLSAACPCYFERRSKCRVRAFYYTSASTYESAAEELRGEARMCERYVVAQPAAARR